MNRIAQIKNSVDKNKKILIKFMIVVSIVFSLLNLSLEKIGLNTISIAILLIFNFIVSTYFAYILKNDIQKLSIQSFLQMMHQYLKEISLLALFQLSVIILWIVLLKVLSMFQYVILFIQPLTILLYVILNFINFKIIFQIFDKGNMNLKKALSGIKSNLRILFYLILKTVIILLIGTICVYLVNIFVYAKEIDLVLKTAPVVTDALINPFFSTTLSNFIQSFGAQMISGMILIWIANAGLVLDNCR